MNNCKYEIILSALLAHPTIREASHACGVPEQTIYAWLRKAEFRAEYGKRRREIVQNTCAYLQVKIADATETVIGLMGDTNIPAQTRLNAARTVLEYAGKITEQTDIIDRIDELEQTAYNQSERFS